MLRRRQQKGEPQVQALGCRHLDWVLSVGRNCSWLQQKGIRRQEGGLRHRDGLNKEDSYVKLLKSGFLPVNTLKSSLEAVSSKWGVWEWDGGGQGRGRENEVVFG